MKYLYVIIEIEYIKYNSDDTLHTSLLYIIENIYNYFSKFILSTEINHSHGGLGNSGKNIVFQKKG